MNKIKEYIEELESLFDLCDASDAYESLQVIKKYIENLQSQLIKEANENKTLKSNWEALKEWLIEQRKYDHGEDKYGDTLDKMNELESDRND